MSPWWAFHLLFHTSWYKIPTGTRQGFWNLKIMLADYDLSNTDFEHIELYSTPK